MTYSIVARDPETGFLGIAVASRFFAVGALVPHIRGRVGAVATQAFVSPIYGTDGLVLLEKGKSPKEVIAVVTGRDAGYEQRQMHLIDAHGHNAAFTGSRCIDWAGHLVDDNISVAGNMLAGPQVVEKTLRGFIEASDKPFAERFLIAMQAGEDAGGDKRGRQSAALKIYRDQDYAWLDIRTDDHADPLAELRRLYAVAKERFLVVAETMATRGNYDGMIDRTVIDRQIADFDADREARGIASASYMSPPKA